MEIKTFFDKETHSFTYLIYDRQGGNAAIIDPVLQYNATTGWVSTQQADKLITALKENNLTLKWILETHFHLNHMTAAYYLKSKVGGKIAISRYITKIQHFFKTFFNLSHTFLADGSEFDDLLSDNSLLSIGDIEINILETPGNTPANLCYLINEYAFIGNTLFMPDIGSDRCDFPGGSPEQLYHSVQKIYALPESTQLLLCHDKPPKTRHVSNSIVLSEQKNLNIHLNKQTSLDEFVQLRTEKDEQQHYPDLFLPSVQVNILAGRYPAPEKNGINYLKIPMNYL